jgi:hypothetical protein
VIRANKITDFPPGVKQFLKVDYGPGVYTSNLLEIEDIGVRNFFTKSLKLIHDKKCAIKVESSGSITDAINIPI